MRSDGSEEIISRKKNKIKNASHLQVRFDVVRYGREKVDKDQEKWKKKIIDLKQTEWWQ